MSQMRLHELAKALGVQSKALMSDLAKEGVQVATHMAAVDEKIIKALTKKYSDIASKVSEFEKAAASAEAEPKKKVARAPKGSKPVTKKKAAKGGQEVEEVEEGPSVELVQRDSGAPGETVTLEQRVVKEGIIRRRRVDPSTASPAPASAVEPTPAPVESDAEIEAPKSSTPSVAALPKTPLPVIRRVAAPQPAPEEQESKPKVLEVQETAVTPEPVKAPVQPAAPVVEKPAAVVPAPAAPQPVQRQPLRPFGAGTPSTGRNLSAPSRLKVVDVPAVPPKPYTPPAPRTPSTASGSASAQKRTFAQPAAPVAEAPAATTEEARKDAAKKKAASRVGGEDSRLTKKALLGMMEEVEITRPLSRRGKKTVQRVEKKSTQITTPGLQKRKIKIHDEISVMDLANEMGIKGADLVRKLISMGQMVSMQHKLDFETASLIASDYKYEVINVAESAEKLMEQELLVGASEESENMTGRPPIVTIMGHVDHGKTSLLDYIRKSRVVAGEAGGITQHIGAYQVSHNGKLITFLDTPGHAAFTAMRARGASVTDIVILVVAADEGVKPQTLEALAHAQAAKVPIMVAINKIDKPEAKPEVVIQELSGKGLVPEDWGGDTIYVKLSAKTGQGVSDLLEMILIQSEVLDLKADPSRAAKGLVIESRLDKGKGPVASVIVQSGTLNQGDPVVSGSSFGKVRAMFDDQGKPIKTAGPSTPVEILGFDGVPEVGDSVYSASEDAIARKASDLAAQAKKRQEALKSSRLSLEDMYKKMQAGDVSELRVVLKGDVQGSVEAIADSLEKIKHEKVRVNIIFKAVGGITESDVDLAAASGAIVFGFSVRPTSQAKELAHRDGVQIKTYDIIYELIDEVKLAMQGLLAPIVKETILGQAEVREVFNLSKVGPIAGCFVKSGKIVRNANARVIRDSVVVYTAKIQGLRRFKEDAKEVLENIECGIRVENFSDLKRGDIIECFETTEVKQAVG
jgi:translation initiation factor IF-2